MKYDFLVVGSGFSGCVLAERIANQLDKKVLIVEKRDHIGGNCYDYYDEHGILVHKYGPHLFHTKMQKVWEYLSQFTGWHPYEHKVLAVIDDQTVPIPFNFNTIEKLFDKDKAQRLNSLLVQRYGEGKKIPILKLMETDEPELKELADYIYKKMFLGYNIKQWGFKPEELDFTVSSRVPVTLSRDNRYFHDKFQAIPKNGYTELFKKMIDHENIDLVLNKDYKDVQNEVDFQKMIYTGEIDYYYDFKLGKLPYRSLRFDLKNEKVEYFQDSTQVNYPNDHDYTRITEFKHCTGQVSNSTTIAYEYPEPYEFGKNDPYYPVPRDENHELFKQYEELAANEKDVYFTGRLANYKYYNMDETVGVALQLFEKKIAKLYE